MKNLILIQKICTQYEIAPSFIEELENIGLIQIQQIEQDKFINEDVLTDLEKIIRLHRELKVNIEGIDIIFNMLQREKQLKKQLVALQNRLRLYEETFS